MSIITTYFYQVTGYVLISHVDVRRIVLPSLQIIRGRDLFKLNVKEEAFALMVTLSKMHNLELPALRGKKPFFLLLVFEPLTSSSKFDFEPLMSSYKILLIFVI